MTNLTLIFILEKMKNDENQINTEKPDALSLKNEIIGIILLFITIFLIFSVISYKPTDASFFHDTPIKNVANYGGRVGAEIAALLFNLFGFTSYITLVYLLFMTSFFMLNKRIKNVITKSCGYFLLLLSSSAFIANVKPETVIFGQNIKTGGIIGYLINDFFQAQIKQVFSLLFFLLLIVISLILAAKIS
ncbi:MAG: DNA translocase FtsK 4TM domain-containing protein, partial [Candidatus Aminicenantes bacterium]|nr:DNA translocase FtsK 4TM domain-containing protein [Candidatus Aminicenantes bacterium]